MSDKSPVSQTHAALILKTAPRIDEYPFAEEDVLAEIGIYRREESDG